MLVFIWNLLLSTTNEYPCARVSVIFRHSSYHIVLTKLATSSQRGGGRGEEKGTAGDIYIYIYIYIYIHIYKVNFLQPDPCWASANPMVSWSEVGNWPWPLWLDTVQTEYQWLATAGHSTGHSYFSDHDVVDNSTGHYWPVHSLSCVSAPRHHRESMANFSAVLSTAGNIHW